MSIDLLQERIRKYKSPLIVDLSMKMEHIPPQLREGKSPWGDEIIGSFTLYITSESEIDIGDTDYNTPGRYSGFGLASQSYSSEGNTYCFSGGFEEMADLKADQDEEFGILTFNVNDSAYYIQIQTFFG